MLHLRRPCVLRIFPASASAAYNREQMSFTICFLSDISQTAFVRTLAKNKSSKLRASDLLVQQLYCFE
jgi:hypothetical protein